MFKLCHHYGDVVHTAKSKAKRSSILHVKFHLFRKGLRIVIIRLSLYGDPLLSQLNQHIKKFTAWRLHVKTDFRLSAAILSKSP